MNTGPRLHDSPAVMILLAGPRPPRAAPWLAAALVVLAPACALDDLAAPARDTSDAPATLTAPTDDGGAASVRVCSSRPIRCLAQVRTEAATGRIQVHATRPTGLGAPDVEQAYGIDPSRTATSHPTVAIVSAYGYAALESDLAQYRAQYGLPACTVAGGCLKVLNQHGQTSPMPPAPPASDDWTVETALDLDMTSAGCPRCNLVAVLADNSDNDNLNAAEDAAAALEPDVISNSWGGPEDASVPASEVHFDHPGIAIFTAAGDDGYNDEFSSDGAGPDYPGTSAHVIAVGATRLLRDTSARGWSERAWAVTGTTDKSAGGSACSGMIAKPAYQTDSPCPFKATSDIAAVGDPATGVAVYNAASAGWITVGGTSAASPLVAAIFAATGHGAQASGAFIAANAAKLHDVVSGNNGTCPDTRLCNAGVGWDGPTGYGTPNASALMGTAAPSSDADGSCSAAGGGAGTSLGALLALGAVARRRRPLHRAR